MTWYWPSAGPTSLKGTRRNRNTGRPPCQDTTCRALCRFEENDEDDGSLTARQVIAGVALSEGRRRRPGGPKVFSPAWLSQGRFRPILFRRRHRVSAASPRPQVKHRSALMTSYRRPSAPACLIVDDETGNRLLVEGTRFGIRLYDLAPRAMPALRRTSAGTPTSRHDE